VKGCRQGSRGCCHWTCSYPLEQCVLHGVEAGSDAAAARQVEERELPTLLARAIARPPSDRVHGLHWAEDDTEGPVLLGGPEQGASPVRALPPWVSPHSGFTMSRTLLDCINSKGVRVCCKCFYQRVIGHRGVLSQVVFTQRAATATHTFCSASRGWSERLPRFWA